MKPGKLATFIFMLFCVNHSQAQIDFTQWQAGINAGVMVYQGDLTPSPIGSYKTLKPTAGFFVSRIINPSFLLKTNFAFGRIKGDDSKYNDPWWRKERNLYFTSRVIEISELLVWNMFSNNGNELGKRFSPYVFGGLGVSFLKVKRDYSNMSKNFFIDFPQVQAGFNADISITPPRTAIVLPVGIGVEYYVNPRFSLTAETNFRYTFTDYLDGFSRGANPSKKDFYQTHTLGLLYRFGKQDKLGCPVMTY